MTHASSATVPRAWSVCSGRSVPGVPQQGPGGSAAEGRMATVAMIYNPVPDLRECWAKPTRKRPEWAARYVASLGGPAALAEPLRRQAAQVGMDRAQRWIALSDG